MPIELIELEANSIVRIHKRDGNDRFLAIITMQTFFEKREICKRQAIFVSLEPCKDASRYFVS